MDIKEQLRLIPESSGSYQFFDKDDLIIMVIREPLRWNPPCDFCDKKKSSECPDEYEWGRCPDPQFHYHAFRFRKDDNIQNSVKRNFSPRRLERRPARFRLQTALL